MKYSNKPLYISNTTKYDELTINKEYLVMGIVMIDGYLNYLIDQSGMIFACPTQFFEIIDNIIPNNWFFKAYTIDHFNYVNVEALFGYYELIYDENHYERLICADEDARLIYFNRKIEYERSMLFNEEN